MLIPTRCSEISFTPKSEQEQEHVLEEKSISMIALPAMRVQRSSDSDRTERDNASTTYSSKAQIVMQTPKGRPTVRSSPRELSPRESALREPVTMNGGVYGNGNGNGSDSDSSATTATEQQQGAMGPQYEQLQQQLSLWQQQLLTNQKLLASQSENLSSSDEQSLQLQQLQLQIQLQQQMMSQLQQSMQVTMATRHDHKCLIVKLGTKSHVFMYMYTTVIILIMS
jgi:hypothetical protein